MKTLACSAITCVVLGATSLHAQNQSGQPSGPAQVQASCNAEAGTLSGASRDAFMLKCAREKTSIADKTRACEYQMADAISKKAQRDPVLREQFLEGCVKNWKPSMR